MIIYQFCSSVNEANLYLVIDEDSREALIIDMHEWCEGLTKAIHENEIIVKGIFITHSHYDHNSGLNYLPLEYRNLSLYPSRQFFKDHNTDSIIKLGRIDAHILPLPGHTEDSVGLYFPSV
jgi:glyoxylase-like metal-dependent hydrolase (beta-lactamase superfamily II)